MMCPVIFNIRLRLIQQLFYLISFYLVFVYLYGLDMLNLSIINLPHSFHLITLLPFHLYQSMSYRFSLFYLLAPHLIAFTLKYLKLLSIILLAWMFLHTQHQLIHSKTKIWIYQIHDFLSMSFHLNHFDCFNFCVFYSFYRLLLFILQ